jgi:type IV pilus assembly protein PilY1
MNKLMLALLAALVGGLAANSAVAQTMNNYTAYPPFINKSVPPAVMLMMTKDHRLFFKGYNDLVDLDGSKDSVTGLPNTPSGTTDGVETTYADYIDYVGYFDPKKCYDYASAGTTGFTDTGRFDPSGAAGNSSASGTSYGHTCLGNWSGNFLNWATMARIDIIRKVLYGGKRVVDDAGTSTSATSGSPGNGLTVLGRTVTPRDAHSWAKVYTGSNVAEFVPSSFTSSNTITICNTNSASSETVGMMLVLKGSFPNADSTEIKQCFPGAGSFVATDIVKTYRVAVKVCDYTKGLESNCDTYLDDNGATPTNKITHKPQGLLQRMAVNSNGSVGTKDDTTTMRFGLVSGSYDKNFSGGVLRSKIADLYGQEIDRGTGQILSTSKAIRTIDMFRVVGYDFTNFKYNASPAGNDGTCYVEGGIPTEGTCRSCGEPFAEMFYEAIRYFTGLAKSGNATTQFYSASPDNGITSYAMGVGGAGLFASTTFPVEASNAYGDPYAATAPALPTCEYCAKPFVLMFGDAFPSHDSDQLPGAYAWSSAPNQVTPTPNDTVSPALPASIDISTLLTASSMNTLDPITSVFVGEVGGGTANSICSAKATTTFLNIRGLCPEEPNKYGTYYLPILAHYAKTNDLRGALGKDTDNTVKQNITTYAVVSSSPVPVLEFTVGGNKVQITPAFHSGCPDRQVNAPASDPKKFLGCQAWGGNSSTTTPISLNGAGLGAWGTGTPPNPPPLPLGSAASGGNKGQLVGFSLCPNDADWSGVAGEKTVNGFTSCYEIMWDDATYGGDFDLDIRYRLYIKNNGTTTITVKTKPMYANSGNGNWAGFYINGVSAAGHTAVNSAAVPLNNILTGSGEYYDIRCGGTVPKADGSGYPSTVGGNTQCQGYNQNEAGPPSRVVPIRINGLSEPSR